MRLSAPALTFAQIRIENTNRCGYRCIMCPREKLTRPMGTMSVADLALVLELVHPGAPEFHLHGYGEPLLDPGLVEKVRLVRRRYPGTSVVLFSTLGVKQPAGFFADLVEAGLSAIRVSCYGFSAATYPLVHGAARFDVVCDNIRSLAAACKDGGRSVRLSVITTHASFWRRRGLAEQQLAQRESFLQWLRACGLQVSDRFAPHNYGGGRAYRRPATRGLCSVVWGARREILQVTWDLKVIPCCFDFDATVVLGDLRRQSLRDIFTSVPYLRFIEAHKNNALSDYRICLGCERCFAKSLLTNRGPADAKNDGGEPPMA